MKVFKKLLVLLIVISQLFIMPVKANSEVEAFVERLYKNCLNRKADSSGLKYWSDALNNKTKTGADVARGFFFSKEMTDMKLSDDEWIERCYKALLDRSSDKGGKKYWLDILAKSNDKNVVLKGFIESKEFTGICKRYGVNRGNYSASYTTNTSSNTNTSIPTNETVNAFVKRLYKVALGRNADNKGLNYWIQLLMEKRKTPMQVATDGFFNSKEFKNKNTNNNDFVDILYRTFLDRKADANGKKYWLNKLSSGVSRNEVIRGFASSKEFQKIIETSGWKEASNKYISSRLSDPTSMIFIANKKRSVSSSYVPSDLVNPNVSGSGSRMMRQEAARALEKMFAAASSNGLYLYASSGYRSYSTQSYLYNNYVSFDGVANADRYSARPGYSEHQLGLAMDITNGGGLSDYFGNTKEGKWLKENAHKYGFILRYTSTKENITGYKYEPWHFRYVGIDYATAIYSEGSEMTMEEYFGVPGGGY